MQMTECILYVIGCSKVSDYHDLYRATGSVDARYHTVAIQRCYKSGFSFFSRQLGF